MYYDSSIFPGYAGSHLLAFIGASLVHLAVASWVMQPQPPLAMPLQQVVQARLVAPSTLAQEAVPKPIPFIKNTKEVMLPVKTKGMFKQAPPKIRKATPAKRVFQHKLVTPKHALPSDTRLTSGIQAKNATATAAAITKPVAAAYLNNPPPHYPPVARRRKQEGTVMLHVDVTSHGTTRAVKLSHSSGHDLLDKAALEAVKKWRFVPARRGSEEIAASVTVPIQFRIN